MFSQSHKATDAGALSTNAAIGIEHVLDGWVGAAVVGGGVAAVAGQSALFFHPREVAEA